MRLTPAETRAVQFVVLLLGLSLLARVVSRPAPVRLEGQAAAGVPAPLEKGADEAPAGPLDVNAATARQLDALPGIGATTAQRIVEARKKGRIETVEDLARVKGIGKARAEALAPVFRLKPGPVRERADAPPEPDARSGRTSLAPAQASDRESAADAESPRRERARTPAGRPGPGGLPGKAPAAPVNLNRASAAELERLPGIGPSLAARILAKRDSVRTFRSWEQLDSIRGVGPALLGRLREVAVLR